MRHVIFASTVAARPVSVLHSAATAHLVTLAGSPQGSATRQRCTDPAIDIAAVATAANQHLISAIGTQKKPCRRDDVAATAATWTRLRPSAIMPLHSCLCTV